MKVIFLEVICSSTKHTKFFNDNYNRVVALIMKVSPSCSFVWLGYLELKSATVDELC